MYCCSFLDSACCTALFFLLIEFCAFQRQAVQNAGSFLWVNLCQNWVPGAGTVAAGPVVVRREDPDQVPSAFPNQNQAPGPSLLRRQQRHLTGLLAWETCGLSVFFRINHVWPEREIYIVFPYMCTCILGFYIYICICMYACMYVYLSKEFS